MKEKQEKKGCGVYTYYTVNQERTKSITQLLLSQMKTLQTRFCLFKSYLSLSSDSCSGLQYLIWI